MTVDRTIGFQVRLKSHYVYVHLGKVRRNSYLEQNYSLNIPLQVPSAFSPSLSDEKIPFILILIFKYLLDVGS